MPIQTNRIYEFNFENLTIRDFLLLNRYSNGQNSPEAIEAFVNLGARFCDLDPLDLPWSELNNFVTQLSEGLVIAFRLPDADGTKE